MCSSFNVTLNESVVCFKYKANFYFPFLIICLFIRVDYSNASYPASAKSNDVNSRDIPNPTDQVTQTLFNPKASLRKTPS